MSVDSTWRWGAFARAPRGGDLASSLLEQVPGLRRLRNALRKLRRLSTAILDCDPSDASASRIAGLLTLLMKLTWAVPADDKNSHVWGIETDSVVTPWVYALSEEKGRYYLKLHSHPDPLKPGVYVVQAHAPQKQLLDAIVGAAEASPSNEILASDQVLRGADSLRGQPGRPRKDLESRWEKARGLKELLGTWANAAAAYNREHGTDFTAKQMEAWGRDLEKCRRKRLPHSSQLKRAA